MTLGFGLSSDTTRGGIAHRVIAAVCRRRWSIALFTGLAAIALAGHRAPANPGALTEMEPGILQRHFDSFLQTAGAGFGYVGSLAGGSQELLESARAVVQDVEALAADSGREIGALVAGVDDRSLLIMACLGLAATAALVILFAILLGRRDISFRNGEEVIAGTGAPCLGVVPEIKRNSEIERIRFSESVWQLAVSLGLVGGTPPRIILVASANRGDGKSVLTIALAKCLSDTGQRVLAINASPNSVRSADPELGPTLEELLGSDRSRFMDPENSQSIHMVGRSSGPGDRRLFGKAFDEFIREAQERYDTIFIEAAPTGLLSDALILARHAHLVLLSVRARKTRRSEVLPCLASFACAGVGVAGIVLSRVDARTANASRYGSRAARRIVERSLLAERHRPALLVPLREAEAPAPRQRARNIEQSESAGSGYDATQPSFATAGDG